MWIQFVCLNDWKADRAHILGLIRSKQWSPVEVGTWNLMEYNSGQLEINVLSGVCSGERNAKIYQTRRSPW